MENNPLKKVLVTGATGILGRVIVLNLLKQGHEVKALKRKTSKIEEVKASYQYYTDQAEDYFAKINWVEADFNDVNELEQLVNGIDEVYHCAAKVSFNPRDGKAMYETNFVGTQNLLFACEKSTVKKFCFISSIAVLDGYNEEGLQDESCDYNTKLDHSFYAKTKHYSEMEVWRASAEGLNVVILNPSVIIGTGNWDSSSGRMFTELAKLPYTTEGTTSYVDVRDVAEIAVKLMDQNIFAERFIVNAENVNNHVVANQVRAKLGKSETKNISKSVLDFGRILNIALGWLIPSLKMANKSNIEALTSESKISNKKIVDRLNYQFIPVQESIDFHLNNYIQDKK